MPIYEYRCTKCGHEFEKIQKFSDPPIKKCPECAAAVEKLISRSAFQLKGSGWYVTDYGGKSGGNQVAKDSGKSKPEGSDSGSSSKADDKPKAKPDKD